MGISERKEREKQEMRRLILSTAANLFVKNGCTKTSIRSIAEQMEYSPATIYLYFKDKNELLYAISEEGFRCFYTYLTDLPKVVCPMAKLKALGKQYFQFADRSSGVL